MNDLKMYLTKIFINSGAKELGKVNVPDEYSGLAKGQGLSLAQASDLVRETWNEFCYANGVTLRAYVENTFEINGWK